MIAFDWRMYKLKNGTETAIWAADQIERLTYEAEELKSNMLQLLTCREKEGERLDWLLARISDSERSRLVGAMDDRFSSSEWRDKIDKAMGGRNET